MKLQNKDTILFTQPFSSDIHITAGNLMLTPGTKRNKTSYPFPFALPFRTDAQIYIDLQHVTHAIVIAVQLRPNRNDITLQSHCFHTTIRVRLQSVTNNTLFTPQLYRRKERLPNASHSP